MPPTLKLRPIPTPPTTITEPSVEALLFALFAKVIIWFVKLPRCVRLSNVAVLQTTTPPVDVLTAVSVQAVSAVTPNVPKVACVTTRLSLSNIAPPYILPPTPKPPVITRAPLVVEILCVALLNSKAFDVTVLLLVILCSVAVL